MLKASPHKRQMNVSNIASLYVAHWPTSPVVRNALSWLSHRSSAISEAAFLKIPTLFLIRSSPIKLTLGNASWMKSFSLLKISNETSSLTFAECRHTVFVCFSDVLLVKCLIMTVGKVLDPSKGNTEVSHLSHTEMQLHKIRAIKRFW